MFRKRYLKGQLFQVTATLSGMLALMCLGMHFGWPSPTIPQLLQDNSPTAMSSEESSWVVILPCFGGVAGAISAAVLLDKIGRKCCILLASPIYLLCWLLIAYSDSLTLLYCTRFLVGIADGLALTAFPIYVCEIADNHIRGFLCSLISIGILLGLLLINIIGSYCTITATALISAILPILHFLTFLWIPESPYLLVLRKQDKAAAQSLKMFKGTNDITEELIKLQEVVHEETNNAGKFMDLVTVKSNRKALFTVMLVRGVQQFSGYTAITFYTQTIFDKAGGAVSSSTSAIIYISVQLAAAIFSSVIVDKAGRRPLLMVSIIGSAIALFIEGCYFYLISTNPSSVTNLGFLPLSALLLFIVLFYVGLGTIPVIILGELFPTNVKAFAMCVADIYYSLVVAVVSKLFHVINDTFGMYIPFLGFSACCIIGCFLIFCYVPETNGKALEEIHRALENSDRKKNSSRT